MSSESDGMGIASKGIASIGTASKRIASKVIASWADQLFPRNALFSIRAEDARWRHFVQK